MKLAVITARGGSKRIPRKNIRNFCGKPIIAYSIQTVIESGCFDEIMVSTDDEEIATIARHYGAKIPFMRSKQAANDQATTAEVLLEVLGEYRKRDVKFDLMCCIYPTAPFVTPENLEKGLNILLDNTHMNAVIPVARFSYPIQRALRIIDGCVSLFQPEHLLTRSQDLEPAYHDAGQFYWVRVAEFYKSRSLMGPGTAALILPEWQVQDVDNEGDWVIAELKYKMLQSSCKH